MTKGLSQLVWWASALAVLVAGAPANVLASFTDLAQTIGYDEPGTVFGLVPEDEGANPSDPPIPLRYRYSPFGEAYAESGPRLESAHFAVGIDEIESTAGATVSQGAGPDAAGGLVLSLSLPLDPAALAARLAVERLEGGTWTGFAVELGHLRPTPGTFGGTDPDRATLILLPVTGRQRVVSYLIRLPDTLARPATLERQVPATTGDPVIHRLRQTQDLINVTHGGR